jgi:hypothetical protein
METVAGEAMTRAPSGPAQADETLRALADLERIVASLGARPAPADSRVPLGRQAHRTVSHLVARDIEAVRDELRSAAAATHRALSSLEARIGALEALAGSLLDPSRPLADGRPGPARRIDDLQDRLLALEAALGAGPESVAVLLERVDRAERELARRGGMGPPDAGG